MKTTILLALIFAIVFFSSCSKLPVHQSQKNVSNEKENFINPLHTSFDKKSNISYGVANDTTHLYIQAIFRERENLMKIMRGGLTVYIDPEGKKKKKYQLKIEKSEVQLTDYELMTRQGNYNLSNQQQNMPATIDIMFNKVTWDKNGDEFVFLRNLKQEPISVNLGPNKQNELLLEIKIPLSELPLDAGQNLFSVGIETGSVTNSNTSGRTNSGMRPSGGGMSGRGGGGGGRGGGGGGGKSGGGGMSGGGSGGSRPGGGSPSAMQPIKLWFQVQL